MAPRVPSVGQVAGLEVVVVVPETVVVVNWQACQFTMVLVPVPPVTVAVRVVDSPRIMVAATEELNVTVTTLALLLLPQPASHKQAMVTAPAAPLQMRLDFITPASPSARARSPMMFRLRWFSLLPSTFCASPLTMHSIPPR